MNKNIKRNTNLLMITCVILVVSSIVGSALPFISSSNVLEIDGNVIFTGPIFQSDYMAGGLFNAGVVTWTKIPVATFSSVGSSDTVILFQVNTSTLTPAQKTTLVSFVQGGGKLIIWDSDGGTFTLIGTALPNDYSWLPTNLIFSTSSSQPGGVFGILTINEENDLSSSISSNPKFINTTNLTPFTDSVADLNIVKTNGIDWCQDMFGQNSATPPQSGPAHMYSRLGGSAVNGFIVYSALDWDFAGFGAGDVSFNGGGNELKKMLQFELEVNNKSNLPCKTPVIRQKFTVTKDFRFTDVNFSATPAQLGTLLPKNDSKFNVSYVIQPKTGTVASTNPGQLYGVVSVNGTGVQNITVADTFGTQFVVNPAHLDGGVDVLRVNTKTGIATIITDTQVTASTVSATGPVDLTINLTTPLASDETVMVYIKYMTALKFQLPNYADFVNTAVVTTNLDGSKTAAATINFV